jgi:hypothetical protein
MIINCKKMRDFEKKLLKKEKINIKRNFMIVDALYKEAVTLGALPLKDPLEGIDIAIKIARVVNSVSKPA